MTTAPSPDGRSRPMRLICVGLPRCATESLQHALLKLGFNGVYHGWIPLLDRDQDNIVWSDLVKSKYRTQHRALDRTAFDQILGDYEAVTDAPGCFFAGELINAYPEAKVLINTREFEAWNRSAQSTIIPAMEDWSLWFISWFHPIIWRTMTTFCDGQLYFWNGMGNLRHPKQRFEEHFAMAKGLAINKDREWLEWTAEQGWEPLCKFLDLPVPDEPFPHGNPPKAFLDRIEKKKSDCTVDIVKWSLWGLGGLATSFAALRYLKR